VYALAIFITRQRKMLSKSWLESLARRLIEALCLKGVQMNLNQVTLPVNNMEKSTQFYQDLGFTQIVDTPHYARFECPEGDSTFSLSLENSDAKCGAVIYFEHQQLDDWVIKLKLKGFSFDQEPTDQSYLWREAVLHDPSGHQIKLYWAGENRINPPWRDEMRR
jgi:catechol 2,3-dioxygenase-like lactoylglutathione lyase family enzyme